MKFAKLCILPGIVLCAALSASCIHAQSVSTTTVQDTVYLANGAPASGTLQLSWPAFTTADNQAIAAGRLSVEIAADGFVSVNVAPNQGASPAGLFYTAIYHLNDGTTSTEYWTIPDAAQATIGEVRAQVMPAAQAVQAVNKTYVDQSIQELAQSLLTASGGNLSGPLYLNGDPAVPNQAANKHYVDSTFAEALPVTGGIAGGPLTATQLGAVYQADQSPGTDFTSKLQACINGLDSTYGGTCDARNFPGALTLAAPLSIANPNITVLLPCATISAASAIVIAPGTRNVTLHGCASRGTSTASGSQGGTVFLSSGPSALFQIGDSSYSTDTLGFHLDNVAINTTSSNSAGAQALAAWRTQELNLDSLYVLGNADQTGITLDGTGNYTGGTFQNLQIGGYKIALNAIGHQTANSASTDWLNAGTFLRLHINCPISNGSPIAGTVGINLQQGDGNTFTGGDVEGCDTALHLGPNAQNNTIVGLRNENSNSQVIADAGSAYNNWITGGTMFTGKLADNGTRNSFLDTFHRSFNALNGDWYGSQQDATLTNHFRLGIGSGSERGLLNRYQTDYGYRWTTGISDASAGEQFYQVFDELNNVNRLSVGQYNNGQSSTNNQTALNSAGTGAIVLNGSTNAGTGGVVFGSGGTSSTTVATVDKAGNASFTGTMQVGSTAQSAGTITVRNNADTEVDYYLWPGLTASQKGSFTYKDYDGASQWYMLKDASNNWALNSATGGIDSIKAYQSGNSGDTYVNAQKSSGVVRVNYEPGSGTAFNIYGGSSGSLYASFSGASSIKLPGLAASSGTNCLQIDNSGYLSKSGAPCSSGSSNVATGTVGQIAYYNANGTAIAGLNAVPLSSGGTGASDAATALTNLGALPSSGGSLTGALTGTSAYFSGNVTSATRAPVVNTVVAKDAAGMTREIEVFPTSTITDFANGATVGSIEWAINQLGASGGGKVKVLPGVYPVSGPLIINYAGIMLEGAGWQTEQSVTAGTIIRASGTWSGAQVLQVGNGGDVVGTLIQNLQVDCNGKGANGIGITPGAGVSIYGTIDRTSVVSCVNGISATGANTFDWTLSKSRILGNTNGVVLQSNAWRLIADEVDNNTIDGLKVDSTFGLTISGGDYEGNGVNNIHFTNAVGNVGGVSISGAYFEPSSTTQRDIKFDSTGTHFFLGADIGGNYFGGANITPYSIETPSGLTMQGLNIHGNHFDGQVTNAIHNQGCAGCYSAGNYSALTMFDSTTGFDLNEPTSNGIIFNHAVNFNAQSTFSNGLYSQYIEALPSSNLAFYIDNPSLSYNFHENQTATSGANYNSAALAQWASYWNGTAAANDIWQWYVNLGAGANPTTTYTLLHSGSNGAAKVDLGSVALQWGGGSAISSSNNVTQTIASGTAAMTTAAITAGTCGTTVTVAATGVISTDTINWSFNAAPNGTQAGLVAWPTAGDVNFAYCGIAETPAAITINWSVTR